MDYSVVYESKKRGTFDFPIELYYVDKNAPRYQMSLHWHIEYELITILDGEFELSLNGRKTVMHKGDCAWVGEGVVHGGIPHDCIYECIVFDLQSFLHNMPVCSKNAKKFLSSSQNYTGIYEKGSAVADIADRIFNSMECERKGYEFNTIGLMWQLIGEFISLSPQNDYIVEDEYRVEMLKEVLSYMKKNVDKHIALDELAKTVGMSPKYFCRVFKEVTGRTPIEYLNYFRIEAACEKLKLTNEPITQIALACGYNDMSYFSKTFCRYKNTSPSNFRKDVNKRLK